MTILLWFVAGLALGLLLRSSEALLTRVAQFVMFTVYAVVAAQGIYLGSTPSLQGTFGITVLHGMLFGVLVSAATVGVAQLFFRSRGDDHRGAVSLDKALLLHGLRSAAGVLGLLVVTALAGSLFASKLAPFRSYLGWPLVALLVSIGIETGIRRRELAEQLRSLRTVAGIAATALVGALIAGLLLALVLPYPLPAMVAGALGSGFYSVSGPLITELAGPDAGAVVLLGNLLRESLAMCIIGLLPSLRIGPEAAIALGGATSMDSTLPFLSRTYGSQATLRAIGVGFVLSLAVPVMVPAAYWLLQKLSSG